MECGFNTLRGVPTQRQVPRMFTTMKPVAVSAFMRLSASCMAALAATTSACAVEGIGNLDQIWPFGGIGDIQGVRPGAAASVTFQTGSYSDPLNFVEFEYFGLTGIIPTGLSLQLHKPLPVQRCGTAFRDDRVRAVVLTELGMSVTMSDMKVTSRDFQRDFARMKARARSGEAIFVTSGAEEYVFQAVQPTTWQGALKGKARIRGNLFGTGIEWEASR